MDEQIEPGDVFAFEYLGAPAMACVTNPERQRYVLLKNNELFGGLSFTGRTRQDFNPQLIALTDGDILYVGKVTDIEAFLPYRERLGL